jgi:hypothetical protein
MSDDGMLGTAEMVQRVEPWMERCETCRFALRVDESEWVCRRFPPVHVVHGFSYEGSENTYDHRKGGTATSSDGGGSVSVNIEQPAVDATDWCGEWQPKKAGAM